VKKFLTTAFVAFLVFVASTATAQDFKANFRHFNLVDVGRTEGVEVYRNAKHISHIVGIAPTSSPVLATPIGVMIKDVTNKTFSFYGHLVEGAVLVPVIKYDDGKALAFPALFVRSTQDWGITLLQGEVPFFMQTDGSPVLELRIFDTNTGELSVLSARLDFWNPPSIFDGSVGSFLKVTGRLDQDTRVWLNGAWVSQSAISGTPEGLEIGLFSTSTGQPLLNVGQNIITVVNSAGQCDSVIYRFSPQ
jgi:hypothetical protein